ncbi:MAG: hypothetical protein AAFZ65_08010, partial [Planctomycetota bacterium]
PLVLWGAFPARAVAQRADVRRELAIRDGARSVATAVEALAPGAADWSTRALGLEALERVLAAALEAPPSRPPRAVIAALDDPHPNVRSQALAVLGRCPTWAAALFDPGRFESALAAVLPEERVHAFEAAFAAIEGGADPEPLCAALGRHGLDDDSAAVRERAYAVAGCGLHLAPVRAILATRIEAGWDRDRALRDAIVPLYLAPASAADFAALAAALDGEPGVLFAALAATRGAALDVPRVLDQWPDGMGARARVEPILLAALYAAKPATIARLVASAAARGDVDLCLSVLQARGYEPLLDPLPAADEASARLLLEALSLSPDWWQSREQLFAATARRDLPEATLDALRRPALDGLVPAQDAIASLLPALDPMLAGRALRFLGEEGIARHDVAVAAAWIRCGRPESWLDDFEGQGPLPAVRDALLASIDPATPSSTLARPLGRFAGDDRVIAILAGWVDRLARVNAESEAAGPALATSVVAYGRAAGALGVPRISALLPTYASRSDVAPSLVRALGASEPGRRSLRAAQPWEGWDPDARDEVRVLLFEHDSLGADGLAALLGRLGSLPSHLERRFHDQLALRPTPDVLEALFAFVDSGRSDYRVALALETLGRSGADVAVGLERVFREQRDYANRRAAGAALAAAGAVERLVDLHGVLARGELGPQGPLVETWPADFTPPAEEEQRVLLRDELAIELARLGRPVLVDGAALGQLAARAPSLLERRFDRQPVAGQDRLLYAERWTLRALADDPNAAAAVDASGPWWRGDGLSLVSCGGWLGPAGGAGPRLLAAGQVALLGEQVPARGALATAIRRAIDQAEALGDGPTRARLTRRLARGLRTGELSLDELRTSLGRGLPGFGRPPLGGLRAQLHLADAQAALGVGDGPAARAAVERALSLASEPAPDGAWVDALRARLDG